MKKRPGLETSSPAVSFFLISPLFLNTSYSPSAILDYDWHFSYVAYIRERPKQEPAGRKMGMHQQASREAMGLWAQEGLTTAASGNKREPKVLKS